MKNRLGLFEHPYVDEARAREVLAAPEHRNAARLAADGLWLFEATRPAPLAPEVKQALIRRIAALTEPPA